MSASLPPIASPNGQDTFPYQHRPDDNSIRLRVHLGWKAACRYALSEWSTPFILGALTLFPLWAACLLFPIESRRFGWAAFPIVFILASLSVFVFSAPLALLIRLCSRRRFEIWISDAGLFKRTAHRDIFFPWSKFIWIIERNGDLWLASFLDGCFIPRESFVSSEEFQEFVAIVREIKRTRSSVWRDKWNGRVFGIQSSSESEEPGARSIPR